jgi:hypothetical protein
MFRSNPNFFGVFNFYHGINVGIGSPKADFGWVGNALTQFCGSWSFFNVGLVDGVGEKLDVMGFTRIKGSHEVQSNVGLVLVKVMAKGLIEHKDLH